MSRLYRKPPTDDRGQRAERRLRRLGREIPRLLDEHEQAGVVKGWARARADLTKMLEPQQRSADGFGPVYRVGAWPVERFVRVPIGPRLPSWTAGGESSLYGPTYQVVTFRSVLKWMGFPTGARVCWVDWELEQ